MKSNIVFIFVMILIIPSAFAAYSDYGINDVIVPQSLRSNEDLNLGIIIANNSSVTTDVNITLSIIRPNNTVSYSAFKSYSVTANTASTFNDTILSGDLNLEYSADSYAVLVTIRDEANGNPTNNTYKKYFSVRKGDKKIPVPDMPIILGFVIALTILFIFTRNNSIKSKFKKK